MLEVNYKGENLVVLPKSAESAKHVIMHFLIVFFHIFKFYISHTRLRLCVAVVL